MQIMIIDDILKIRIPDQAGRAGVVSILNGHRNGPRRLEQEIKNDSLSQATGSGENNRNLMASQTQKFNSIDFSVSLKSNTEVRIIG